MTALKISDLDSSIFHSEPAALETQFTHLMEATRRSDMRQQRVNDLLLNAFAGGEDVKPIQARLPSEPERTPAVMGKEASAETIEAFEQDALLDWLDADDLADDNDVDEDRKVVSQPRAEGEDPLDDGHFDYLLSDVGGEELEVRHAEYDMSGIVSPEVLEILQHAEDLDTAVYEGARKDYTITFDPNGDIYVTDNVTGEQDALYDITRIEFSDMSVPVGESLDINPKHR